MSKKRPKSKRPGNQDLVVPTPIHTRLKALAIERKMWLGGLTTMILEAYFKSLDKGTDWLEKPKGER